MENIGLGVRKYQKNINSKYKWEITEHIKYYNSPLFKAKKSIDNEEYYCILSNRTNIYEIINDVNCYETKNNTKLPLVPIIDYIIIDNILYTFYEKFQHFKDVDEINERKLLKLFIEIYDYNLSSIYSFPVLDITIFYKNNEYFVLLIDYNNDVKFKHTIEEYFYDMIIIFKTFDSKFIDKIIKIRDNNHSLNNAIKELKSL